MRQSPDQAPADRAKGHAKQGHLALGREAARWKAVAMERAKRFERIFLATDGSEQSQAAVDATITIAKSQTVKVKVAHVWNLEVHHRHGYWDVEVRSEAQKLVDATVARLLGAGVIAEPQIIRADGDHVAAALAVEAKEFGANLVVVGSRGLSDWRSLTQHSISRQLLSAVDCPVLMARARPRNDPGKVARIVMAIAGGGDVAPAARAAVAVAQPGASVVVLHVAQAMFGTEGFVYVEPADEIRETMSRACELLTDEGITVRGLVAHEGPVAKAVSGVAENWNADLIVIGSSRMGEIGSLFLGSVSHDLLQMANRAVLVAERVPA